MDGASYGPAARLSVTSLLLCFTTSQVPGVLSVSVNLATNTAVITYDPAVTGPRSCLGAVESAGFEASLAPTGATHALSQADRQATLQLWHVHCPLWHASATVCLHSASVPVYPLVCCWRCDAGQMYYSMAWGQQLGRVTTCRQLLSCALCPCTAWHRSACGRGPSVNVWQCQVLLYKEQRCCSSVCMGLPAYSCTSCSSQHAACRLSGPCSYCRCCSTA
jgi:hypothetical protein